MPQHTYALCVLLTFYFFAGKLPKELGNLVNLNFFRLNDNAFTGTTVCPVLHSHTMDMHNRALCALCSDGRREGGTQSEAPALQDLLLRCVSSYTITKLPIRHRIPLHHRTPLFNAAQRHLLFADLLQIAAQARNAKGAALQAAL